MNEQADSQLLRAYAETGSESAFGELVRRHVDFVYSAALRMVWDAHLAEDVTQNVFVALAKNAGQLTECLVLSSWLHRTARNIAVQTIRTDVRRRAREQEAVAMNQLFAAESDASWEQIAPELDAVLGELSEPDREAVFLRYFERKSAQQMAQVLGVTDEAAQKRVTRAVDRLRTLFAKRGVSVGASGLVVLVSANAVQAAPVGLALSITSAAGLAGVAATAAASATVAKTIAMTTIQKAVLAVVATAVVATPLIVQQRNQTRLRAENVWLRQQLDEQARLEDQRRSSAIDETPRTNSQSLPTDQFNELLRLRGEVGRLRAEARQSAQAKETTPKSSPTIRLRQQLVTMPEKDIPELQLLNEDKWAEDADRGKLDTDEGVRETLGHLRRAAKIRFAPTLCATLDKYLLVSNGQLPANIMELKPFFNSSLNAPVLERYEILHAGNARDLPPGEPLIAEKAAVDDEYDTLIKIAANQWIMEGVGQWNHMNMTNSWQGGTFVR